MIFRRFYEDKLAQASFLVGCGSSGEAVVIDPNRDAGLYLAAAAERRLRIVAVTETHIHADFVSGARELAARAQATLHLSDEGPEAWKYAYAGEPNVRRVREGDAIRAGRIRLDVMRTPGHTPESLAFVLTDESASRDPLGIFTGDFVFVGDVGRPDLLERAVNMEGTMEASARTLFHSIRRLRAMPGHLLLWPGHGAGSACGKNLGSLPASTLASERLTNWGLRCESEEEFVSEVLAGQPEPPAYFKEMKRLNQQGPPLGELRAPDACDPAALAMVLDRGGVVVDLRPTSAFAAGYVPGTLHVPMGASFTSWAGWLLPYDQPIHLIAPSTEAASAAVRDLALIGLDAIAGVFGEDALAAWSAARGPLATVSRISAREAWEKSQRGELAILDVRARSEHAAGHVPGERHVPLGYLAARAAELPAGVPIAVHCAGGSRSPIAVSVLRRAGRADVFEIPGGFAEHVREGLPVETGESAAASV